MRIFKVKGAYYMPKKEIKKIDDLQHSPPKANKEWYNLTLSEVSRKLKVDKSGLSQEKVEAQIEKYGLNTLPTQPRTSAVVLFFSQFKSSLTYILLIAAGISFALGEFIDAYVIITAVAFNVIVGFIQEYKAETALLSLKKIITRRVWVIRDGMERAVESAELVPGDIVVLRPGTRVSADGRLFEAEDLKVNEAALTGESEPTEKINRALEGDLVLADQQNMVFAGTVVTEGRGRFFVAATGVNTEIGKIATLVQEVDEVRTPLQTKLDDFSRKLGLIVLCLGVVLIAVGVLYNHGFFEMFITAVAIAVAAIPEGLIVAVTVILTIGMRRILKRGSLVRKLVAAETLGSTNVICADKTGTVTLGEMRVVRLVTASHEVDTEDAKLNLKEIQKEVWELKKLNQIAVYCSNAVVGSAEAKKATAKEDLREQIIIGSSTESALLRSAIDGEFTEAHLHEPRPRLDEIQFNSARKFMASLNRWTKKQNVAYIKGAPEKILRMAGYYQSGRTTRKMDAKKKKELVKMYEKLSRQGLRVLAGGYKSVAADITSFDEIPNYNEDIIFVGFWCIKDPLRSDAKDTIEKTKQAGIRTIIITGDNRYTATSIARELGFKLNSSEIIDGEELAGFSDSQLEKAIKNVKVFSRATPADKLRIVAALQKSGNIVAMTGDGVNDAPALQKADIGIALGSGTDVAKETADIVLLDDNYSTIVAAVREGRVIFDNIKKVILYLLSDSFSEMIIIMLGLLLGWPLVLLPAQILWINLVTDGLPDLALTQEKEEPEIMSEPPRGRDEPILDTERKFLIFFISAFTALSTLGIFYLMLKVTGDVDRARTVAFTTLAIDSLFYVFSVRSVRHTIFETSQLANKWLLAAVGGGFIIQVLGVYLPFFQKVLKTVPLGIAEWILILVVCLWIIGAIELVKHYFIAQRKPEAA